MENDKVINFVPVHFLGLTGRYAGRNWGIALMRGTICVCVCSSIRLLETPPLFSESKPQSRLSTHVARCNRGTFLGETLATGRQTHRLAARVMAMLKFFEPRIGLGMRHQQSMPLPFTQRQIWRDALGLSLVPHQLKPLQKLRIRQACVGVRSVFAGLTESGQHRRGARRNEAKPTKRPLM